MIFAKLWAQGGSGNGTGQGFMQANCQRTAGNDYNQSSTFAKYSMSSAGGGPETPLALNVVHYYGGPGTATLSCNSQYGSFLHFIKITAISVGSLSNTPSP